MAAGRFFVLFALAALAAGGADLTLDFSCGSETSCPESVTFSVGDKVSVTTPDGGGCDFAITAAPCAGIAGRSYIAKDSSGAASAVLGITPGGFRISIDDPAKYSAVTVVAKDGVASFRARRKDEALSENCGACIEPSQAVLGLSEIANPESKPSSGASADDGGFSVAEQKAVVDLLILFDSGAKTWAEDPGNWDGGGTMEEFAEYAVAKMNAVLENSQLLDTMCYRLVGVAAIEGTFESVAAPLAALRNSTAPFGDVPRLRKKCGADAVALLIDRDKSKYTTSGVSYGLSSVDASGIASFNSGNNGVAVCDIKTVFERYTLSHEIGHVMGCGHSDRQGDSSGPQSATYSCGYHFADACGVRRYTVMAYSYTQGEETNYYDYQPVPYFSTPDITPGEYGVPLGTAEKNDNRRVLVQTCGAVGNWQENVFGYDWDVKFLDDDGEEIAPGSYFTVRKYVTLVHDDPNAAIYYTLDGTKPGSDSPCCTPGTRLTVTADDGETKVLTACAVKDGTAMSFRSLVLHEGIVWSGDGAGSGVWKADPSVKNWNGGAEGFWNGYSAVVFGDIAGAESATVTVASAVAPKSATFTATDTAYRFIAGDEGSIVDLSTDPLFAPAGSVTFDIPVKLGAVAFTNAANATVEFNAPFGQSVSASEGYCTNMIGIGAHGTLGISPGAGKTQIFDFFNNVGWFYNNATIRVGAGSVVFKGPVASRGLFGSTKLDVAKDGEVTLDIAEASYDPLDMSVVSGQGTLVYKSLFPVKAAHWSHSGWTGTVVLTNISSSTLAIDNYGWTNSTVRLSGVSGYPGSCGNTNIAFETQVELVDAADGTPAWTVNNGYSTDCTIISKLKGAGTFMTTLSPGRTYVRQGFGVLNASEFSGSLDISGAQFTFGATERKNDSSQNGTIYVDSGVSVTNMAKWTSQNLVLEGELVNKGTLSFAASATFADGASFVAGSRPADGVVLVSGSIATNGTLKVSVLGDESEYVAEVISREDGGMALVLSPAPLPETVEVAISVKRFGDDGWEDAEVIVGLPGAWALEYYPSLRTPADVAAKYAEPAANGAPVWQCYALGLDPTDEASGAKLALSVKGGKIEFSVDGLGEVREIAGIQVYWYLKTSTDLVRDPYFGTNRDYAIGMNPKFSPHPMPDTPSTNSTEAAPVLFYKLSATFIAESQ